MDVREEVCLQIMETLEELGLSFAFPSRAVYLHNTNQDEPERNPRCAAS
jgi:MscS family membrane protein